jgi:hypothetical protein
MVGIIVGGRHLVLSVFRRRAGAVEVHGNFKRKVTALLSITALSERFLEERFEGLLEFGKVDAILGPFRGRPLPAR